MDPNAMAGAGPNAINAVDPNAMAGMEAQPETEDDEAIRQIQSKTGELSQLIHDYSSPNEELEKYVRGMVDASLEKLKDSPEEEIDSNAIPTDGSNLMAGADPNAMAGADQNAVDATDPNAMAQQMPMESKGQKIGTVKFTKKQLNRINEIYGPTSDESERKDIGLEKKAKIAKKKTPFDAPKIK